MNRTENKTLSDIEVIDRVLNGEVAVFEILIRRYNPYLYKIGRSYGYNHQDVEDLMQDAFVHSYENLATLKQRGFFKTWLVRIMLNECYRKSHKTRSWKEVFVNYSLSEKSIPMFSQNSHSETENNIGNRELSSIIENALKRVPIDYRIVFTLRELNGMSVLETAKVLQISDSNVKVRLNRAKGMLRKEIEKMYAPHEIFQFNLIYCDSIVSKVMNQIR
jgi:RNA polymerase sigma factor (sigma-70 family)